MRLGFLTSTGLRHGYVAGRLHERFGLDLVVCEEKGLQSFYEDHPDRELINEHFQHLADTEASFFTGKSWDALAVEPTTVPWGSLNTDELSQQLTDAKLDAVAVFGCGIIKSPVLEVLPKGKTLNIHQGLSPYYRGGATNFWPFVNGELELIGVTLHLIDAGIDTGEIVAHGRPDIEADDTQHSIGCKTIVKSADLLVAALECVEKGIALESVPQWQKGKLYKRKDLTGDAIRKVRELEGSGAVADYVTRRDAGGVPSVRLIELLK